MYNRNQILYQIASRYYLENQSKTDIAKEFKMSRPTVSKLLSEAKTQGIISITITPPIDEDEENLSQFLQEKFNLQSAIITSTNSKGNSKLSVGQSLASFIQQKLFNLQSIGLGWGTTLYEFVQAINPMPMNHLTIVPLMGGAGIASPHLHSNHLCFHLAEKLDANVSYYYAPAIAESISLKKELEASNFIKEAHRKALQVDLAIVSIGNPLSSATYKLLGAVTPDDEIELSNSNICGDVLSSFYNENGETIQTSLSSRMIGVSLNELEMMKEVAVVASGEEKALSLLSLLKRGCVDHLIIDTNLAIYLKNVEY